MTKTIDPATTRDQYRGWQRNIARTRFENTVHAALTLAREIDPDQTGAVLTEATDAYDEALIEWGTL